MIGEGDYPNEGYDEFLEAIEAGDPYYLECENGHGHLPPRRVCPDCGSQDFSDASLPESGEVETYTITSVASPNFAEDTPYVTAVANFGPLSITGQIHDTDHDDLDVGMVVGLDVTEAKTTGEKLIVFPPR